ncbi:hypothetical protein QBC35DRAFT_263369 [Podospora australis]|uniref:Zn(2)-C6 fungal-type domain-containing protein n=1 Tax=Podospora australis TaxID=1536484 RepID=A0AAN7ANS0_9PEZI|nr:hypothetical protein QBC35DRAFT_263369 [Podospora australis]
MVYCGKASQGCQSCRTRRIKCDKVRPQCAQCIRIGKQCPGYRDQLSLMFRDESSKVIKRAHAQWGVSDEVGESSASASSPTSSSSPSASSSTQSPVSARDRTFISESPRATRSLVKARRESQLPRVELPQEISGTVFDKAISFYIDNYVIGLPDEPSVGQELQGRGWVHSPLTKEIMAAVGLAGLSNRTGDKQLNTLAAKHYGQAIQTMSTSINPKSVPHLDLEVILRATVMMAMFEVVRGRENQPPASAQTHIMGGAAILTNFMPFHGSQAEGLRGLLQMCFSMIASIQGGFQYSSPEPNAMIPSKPIVNTGGPKGFPPMFAQWIAMSGNMVTDDDKPSAELIPMIMELVKLSGYVRARPFVDGAPETTGMMSSALGLEKQLEAWERRQKGAWLFVEEQADKGFFPPEAVFEGCYHVYTDMYIARVWNHYRWARIMIAQLLLETTERFPISSSPLYSEEQQRLARECIVRLARDTLVSIPTHYRHPSLQPVQKKQFDRTQGGAVIGIAGIPTLLFEIKVAACAPSVPHHQRLWALGILETIWASMGMFQAQVLAKLLLRTIDEEKRLYGSPPAIIKEER